MKRKVLNVSYRKDSNTFADWMKYEIEILNEDESTTLIPAYGKDLQDALSRVVHDDKVIKLESKVINRVPENGWVVAWFLGFALTLTTIYYFGEGKYVGFYLIGSIFLYALATISVTNWFTLRNKDK